jgi:predicted DNA binding CopG/RHH family protein
MRKVELNPEEQEILDDFEAGKFKSVMTPAFKKAAQSAAEETLKKDKRINIRISSRDLLALQRRAAKEGLPYQTLVSSILHKYVAGSLEDRIANK